MKTPKPPVLADRFLAWFCKDELLEEIQGDLHEHYSRIAGETNAVRTYLVYWFHVFHFLRPFAIRKFIGQNLIYIAMLKSNLIIALRNLYKYKFYSGLNIAGLAMGICCVIFIALWMNDELSYDKYFDNHDRIYRVSSDLKFQDNKWDMALTPAPMAKAFKEDFPEIEAAARFNNGGSSVYRKGDRFINQDGRYFVDPEVFDVFSFEFLYGNPEVALLEPNSAVITRTVAIKYFDDETQAVGQSLVNLNGDPLRIDGVIEDVPINSHFHPKVLISMVGNQFDDGIWLSNNFYTYFLLDKTNDPVLLESKFESVYPKYFGPQLQQLVGATWEQMVQSGSYVRYFLVGLTDIHLHSHQDHEMEANGDIQYVYMFGAIGLFILLIACINFMNISTARAAIRGKEVGVRKVLGSFRHQLISQFLIESVLFSFLALVIAVIFMSLLMPMFESLTGKNIGNPFSIGVEIWLAIIFGTLVIGFLAGTYPAFILSGFRPVLVLKGHLKSGKAGSRVRSILVVFQFAMSAMLIVGTAVVYQQLEFVQNKKLGFNKDGVLIIDNTYTLEDRLQPFKERLLTSPRVESITVTGFLPTGNWRSDTALQPKEATNAEDAVGCQIWGVDHDYVKTMGMKLVAGRDFSKDLVTDSSSVLLNETAARRFGFENAVGRKVKTLGQFLFFGKEEVTVIGVVEDFHFDSMRDNIGPVLIYLNENAAVTAVRFNAGDVDEVIKEVEDAWNEYNPNHPLDYDFMDRQFDAKYEQEAKLGNIFTVFGVFAVIIACLGLFGLSAFTAEQRKKEIGIRKVLGASTTSLVGLLFSGYTKLLIISLVIGLPIAFFMMDNWLNDFAYHTEIGFSVIFLSAMLSLLVAWVTVSFQSMRAARVNPAENLRTE